MSQMSITGGRHVAFCIAEIRAELETELAASEAVRALAQLEDRHAAGEPVTAVCSDALMADLKRQIAADPRRTALRQLDTFEAVLTGAGAKADAASIAVSDNVFSIADARAAKASLATKVAPRRSSLLKAAGRMMAAASLAGLCWIASVRTIAPTSLGATVDISIDTISRALPLRHALLIDTP